MDCPECGTETVAFRVPAALREHAPGEVAAICPACLSVSPAPDAAPDADFSRVIDAFPDGEAGVATALAVGLLVESLALNREAVAALLERAQDAGTDPWLVIERLARAPGVDPDADLDRLRGQLDQLLE